MTHGIRSGMLARTLALVATMVAALGVTADGAFAAPEWTVKSIHAPQAFPPVGSGEYVLLSFNSGDQPTDGSPITLLDSLPAGVVVASPPSGPGWNCSATIVGSSQVTCTRSDVHESAAVPYPGPRGALPVVRVAVSVSAPEGVVENTVTISGGGAATPAYDFDETPIDDSPVGFGLVPSRFVADWFEGSAAAAAPARLAGSHPFEQRVAFDFNQKLTSDELGSYGEPVAHVRTIQVELPPGFVGNVQATAKCTAEQLTSEFCPIASQVGSIDLILQNGDEFSSSNLPSTQDTPVYNMVPPRGTVAAFAFSLVGRPVWILASLDPSDNYAVVTTVRNTNEVFGVISSALTLWGVPADPAHDPLRFDPFAGFGEFGASVGGPPKPFLTLPSQCDTPVSTEVSVDSWDEPGAFVSQSSPPALMSGCEQQEFNPTIAVRATSPAAASPTGLEVDLEVPQNEDPEDLATPNVRTTVTKLPPGMAVNPSAADGLVGCSEAEVGFGDNDDPACPDASKIGTVEIESSLTTAPLTGYIYQAKQSENPHGSLLGFYTVAQGDGLTIKLAAKVEADPASGRLTTTFVDSPQLPFDRYSLDFWGGQRSPLVNPPTCGSFAASAEINSWNSSMPVAHSTDTVQITSGPDGGPCADSLAARPFAPGLSAGSKDPVAGAFSDFALAVSRAEGSQELSRIEAALPPGLLARLADAPYCSEAQLAAISAAPGTGLSQRLSPSCPPASLVGHSDAAAGAGSLPFHNAGSVYLTGPYAGAPLGLAVVTPVVAGPLDLGSVVVRAALHVDPVTARVRVAADPLPSIVHGIPLNLRSVRVTMDRPRFTLNPTNCEAMAVAGRIGSLQGATADVSERYQVGGCAALAFRPSLQLKLKGGTRRSSFPRLRAELRMPGGNANVSRAAVTLPRALILEQGHIRTVCTRVRFAAESCPAGSVYGRARAFSPLLDRPLEGPVYLRSNGGERQLPDLVADLDGQIEIELEGHVDSVRGRLRTTFEAVPDAPISRFVLAMKGGRRGLLVVSRDLCRAADRALVRMDAHNGRRRDFRPVVGDSCG